MRKYFFKLAFLLLNLFLLTSCATEFYQVYKVESQNLLQKDNSMVYENDECKISYNLWGNKGAMAFIFENKTEKDIFIDMTRTFFIKNDAAYDYFKNSSYETRTFDAINLGYSVSRTYIDTHGYWPSQYDVPLLASKKAKTELQTGISSAVTIRESEYVCVPSKSYKVLHYYNINPEIRVTCDMQKDYPSGNVTLFTYNEGNSPLKFKNKIAYSFQKGATSLTYVENNFWVSSIKNYSKRHAVEKKKVLDGCYINRRKQEFFKIGGPNQFYIVYSSML